jgi:hypothetical protein
MAIAPERAHRFRPPKGGEIFVYGYPIIGQAEDFGDENWNIDDLELEHDASHELFVSTRDDLAESLTAMRQLRELVEDDAAEQSAGSADDD